MDICGIARRATARLIASWCLACTAAVMLCGNSVTFGDAGFFERVKLWYILAGTLAAFAVLSLTVKLLKNRFFDAATLPVSVLCYTIVCVFVQPLPWFAVGMLCAVTAAGCYFFSETKREGLRPVKLGGKSAKLCAAVLGFGFFAFVGALTTMRYLMFRTPCFDFGIFCQMFYNMKETLAPLTTCERDGLLSHFAVHFSPIYYVLLPLYAVWSSPVVLQLAQAAVIASGVIPLWLICKRNKLSDKLCVAVCICYVFYPAFSGGCFYDLHENKFLAPLVLWLMYFIERDSTAGIFSLALLIMLVKEDAPVYVAFIALYMVFSRKKIAKGSLLFVFSIAYFGIVLLCMEKFGNGVMVNRYENFIFNPEQGLIGVIYTVIQSPAYVISECFSAEKFEFALLMFLPLACLPLFTKKLSRLILAGPFILINLMPDYIYQHSIYYQYTYGAGALLVFLLIINLSDLRAESKRFTMSFAAAASVILCIATVISPKLGIVDTYFDSKAQIEEIKQVLSVIPEDAQVTASTFFVPYLSKRDVIYQNPSENNTEYVALDFRNITGEQNPVDYLSIYLLKGYTILSQNEYAAVLYMPA